MTASVPALAWYRRGMAALRKKSLALTDLFIALVEQIRQDAVSGDREYDSSRLLTMNRLYLETLREVFSRVKSKVVLDGQQPTDVVISGER